MTLPQLQGFYTEAIFNHVKKNTQEPTAYTMIRLCLKVVLLHCINRFKSVAAKTVVVSLEMATLNLNYKITLRKN